MQPADLEYPKLLELLPAYQRKGLSESAAFLNWFLENIFRLDDTTAQDSICDAPNDKGIDGIYVDHAEQEVLFFQSKLRQNPTATLGDTDLKEFVGSRSQFKSGPKIEALLNGNANTELKKILQRLNVRQYIETGYQPIGIFVANMHIDQNGSDYLANHPEIRLYGKADISQEYIDLDAGIITDAAFTFTIDSAPFEFSVANLAKLYLFAARASELINLPGISDATLFSQNVRLSLGNIDVNKQIKSSIRARGEHLKFPLFHNGITLLCNSATLDRDKLTVRDFVVVNGA
jgi:AIPR protein